jgi:hypothetical protein
MEDVSNPSGKHSPKSRRHGQGSILERTDKPRLSRFAAILSLGTDEDRTPPAPLVLRPDAQGGRGQDGQGSAGDREGTRRRRVSGIAGYQRG